MKYYTEFRDYNFIKTKKVCETIFTFDIETTSVIKLDGVIYEALKYDTLTDEEKERTISLSSMYVWQFGIDDNVYYR